MKAVICPIYGEPEVLKMVEVPKPNPKPTELLVKVKATAVNSGDVRVRGLVVSGCLRFVMRLVLGWNKPRKPILGVVFSGIVEQIGEKVTKFNVGDEVYGTTGFKFGTYAEYLTIAENGIVSHKPKNTYFEEAAALPFGGQTAMYFLKKAKAQPHQQILIYGGTGAVGIAAIQLASYYNTDVTVVCSSKGKSLVETFGIQNIICYDQEDFTKIETKFDLIFDCVGKITKKQCQHMLKPNGKYISVESLDVVKETVNQLEILTSLTEQGLYKAVIDKVYSLDEMVEAHRYVDSGRKKGNVIIKV